MQEESDALCEGCGGRGLIYEVECLAAAPEERKPPASILIHGKVNQGVEGAV